jgi:hypothetical protein
MQQFSQKHCTSPHFIYEECRRHPLNSSKPPSAKNFARPRVELRFCSLAHIVHIFFWPIAFSNLCYETRGTTQIQAQIDLTLTNTFVYFSVVDPPTKKNIKYECMECIFPLLGLLGPSRCLPQWRALPRRNCWNWTAP